MKTVGNILWFVLGGIWLALGYAIGGLVMCITIIGIPFGIQSFKLAGLALWPFGYTTTMGRSGGCLEVIFNIIWLVLFGWAIFVAHIILGLVLCVTIIGIPFGVQAFKISTLALWPFGRVIVRTNTNAGYQS
ncbi:unannotated protein [freshwater metagenome]|jgi:hypothetical protein|uniref:Unannotated protein n=1 Tax=freshwater metagenome TaxID=449393 RepID=A0A6J6ISS8_9ZZZZ|nr:YccF domain-containing protein [Actinomycetota bacterium]MSZ24023.1 YccF domain-containing protein [Actinomycetota bacterium]MSZ93519.1 YccF domain-containing protein [Actinomycetota bacterium]